MKECESCECEAWRTVAIEANKAVGALVRKWCPDIGEHYGMPQDGVRKALLAAQEDMRERCAGMAKEFCGQCMGSGELVNRLRALLTREPSEAGHD